MFAVEVVVLAAAASEYTREGSLDSYHWVCSTEASSANYMPEYILHLTSSKLTLLAGARGQDGSVSHMHEDVVKMQRHHSATSLAQRHVQP